MRGVSRSQDQTRVEKSGSEERKNQEKGHEIIPLCSSLEHVNSYDDGNNRSIEIKAIEVMLDQYQMIELGPWARGPSSIFNDTNRGLEETDNFIRSNLYGANLVEKNREENNTRNQLSEEKQLICGGELQFGHGNPPNGGGKNKILGLDVTNEIGDVCSRKSLKKETLEQVVGINSQPKISKSGKVVRNENNELMKTTSVEGGPSLLQCPSQDKQHESSSKFFNSIGGEDDRNDYICALCGNSGELICCDGCPSTFHQSCLGIQTLPSGDWYCMYCRCKFCGLYFEKQEEGLEGSVKLMTCHICEKRYHLSCVEASGENIVDSEQELLCGNGCKELSKRLKKLVGVKREMEDGFSWSFIRRENVDSNASQLEPHMVECNKKLAGALSVMNQAFMPYFDEESGINIVKSVVYNCGSNFPRLDFKGFVTAILERNDEIVSVASIRIRGNQLAEMVYVATRCINRKQGMFRRLLNAMETALSFLNVELLIVPAILNLKETWIDSFGFEHLDSRSKRMIKDMNVMVFDGTVTLQKKIPKRNFSDENLIPTTVSNLRRSERKRKGKQVVIN